MNTPSWKLKIKAFLHDPPEKALILFDEKHEERAKDLIKKLLGEEEIPKKVEEADHIAAGMDRILNLPSYLIKVDFVKHPLLKHTLTSTKIDLSKYGRLEKGRAKEAVNKAIEEIEKLFQGDERKIFLALWGLFPKLIQKFEGEEEEGLGTLWELLPPETRIPDHYIWDHLIATSAVVPSLQNSSLLLFTIGPVQKFITTSRRTKDLWMGSYLLSYLAWQAIKAVVDEWGPDSVIYPDLRYQPQVKLWLEESLGQIEPLNKPSSEELAIANFPNIFLALLPSEKAEAAAESARNAVGKKWEEIAFKIKDRISEELNLQSSYWEEIWKRQVENFWEVYWVALRWPEATEVVEKYRELIQPNKEWDFGKLYEVIRERSGIGETYQLLYELTDKHLMSRKNLRDFIQEEEPGYKCSLCGEREALHTEGEINFERLREFWRRISEAKDFRYQFEFEGKERLCAVCTLKRLAGRFYFKEKLGIEEEFPSTSEIAATGFKSRVIEKVNSGDTEVIGTLQEFMDLMKRKANELFFAHPVPSLNKFKQGHEEIENLLRLDGEWLQEESLTKEKFEEEGIKIEEEDIRNLREALNKIYKKAGSPSKYYALLYLDADNMKSWLCGEEAPKIAEVMHPEAIKQLEQLKRDDKVKEAYDKVNSLKRPLFPARHRSISAALRNFSVFLVRKVIEERHLGKLVYAGGDDVLAFSPLNELLDVMKELRLLFLGEKWNDKEIESSNGFVKVGNEIFMLMGEKATASMGVAIAHHLHPLSQVLEEARDALLEGAKKEKEKDSFNIRLLRRSGEKKEVKLKWKLKDKKSLDLLKELMEWMKGERILSPRIAYEMKQRGEVFERLPEEAKESQLHRLSTRHSQEGKTEEVSKLLQDLLPLGWNNLADLLILVKFIATEVE